MDFVFAPGPDAALIGVALVAFLAGIVSGMTGFGGGLLLPPVLAPIVGVKAVVPVMAVGMLLSNAHRLWLYRRNLDRRLTGAVLLTAVPGVALGASVYVRLPADAISLILGTFLLLAVPLGRALRRRNIRLGAPALAASAAAYGTLAGTTTGVGMLLVPFLLGAGLAGPALLATDAAIAIGVNMTKSVMFGGYALLTPGLFMAGLMLGLCNLPGNYVARWIVERSTIRLHTAIMEVLILVGAVSLLWRPVGDGLRLLAAS